MTRAELLNQLDLLTSNGTLAGLGIELDIPPEPKKKLTAKRNEGKSIAERRKMFEVLEGEPSTVTLNKVQSNKKVPAKYPSYNKQSSLSSIENKNTNNYRKRDNFETYKKPTNINNNNSSSSSRIANDALIANAYPPPKTPAYSKPSVPSKAEEEIQLSPYGFLYSDYSDDESEEKDGNTMNSASDEDITSGYTTMTSIFSFSPKRKDIPKRSNMLTEIRMRENNLENLKNMVTCIEAVVESENDMILHELEMFTQDLQNSVPYNTYKFRIPTRCIK